MSQNNQDNRFDEQREDDSSYSAKREGPRREILENRRFSLGNDEELADDEYTSIKVGQDGPSSGKSYEGRPQRGASYGGRTTEGSYDDGARDDSWRVRTDATRNDGGRAQDDSWRNARTGATGNDGGRAQDDSWRNARTGAMGNDGGRRPEPDIEGREWKTTGDYRSARTRRPVVPVRDEPEQMPERNQRREDDVMLHTDETLGHRAAANFDTFGQSRSSNRPEKPDSNMVWSVICLLVCLPFGLLALIQAIKVDSKYLDGDYEGAMKASEKSKAFTKLAIYAWMAFFALSFVAYLMGG